MRRSIRFTVAAVVAAFGLSILGIGAALAVPGKPSKPAAVLVSHEHGSKGTSRSGDKPSSRDRAGDPERGDRM